MFNLPDINIITKVYDVVFDAHVSEMYSGPQHY